jgi:hypothetical protein
MLESMGYAAGSLTDVSEDKKRIVKNLYLSNIAEEFVAMQVDLEIPVVISILKELDVYRGKIEGSGSLKPVGRYHSYYGSTCVPKRWTRI